MPDDYTSNRTAPMPAYVENIRTLEAAREAIDQALAIFECHTPAGGLGPGTHCAACCYGTGYLIESHDDDRLVTSLRNTRTAISATLEANR